MKTHFKTLSIILTTLAAVLSANQGAAATLREGSRADLMWELQIEPLIAMTRGFANLQLPWEVAAPARYKHAKMLRELGLEFRAKFPGDGRWRQWLIATVECGFSYQEPSDEYRRLFYEAWNASEEEKYTKGQLIPRNQPALDAWAKTYAKLKSEFLTDSGVTPEEIAQLERNELFNKISADILDPGGALNVRPLPPEVVKTWRTEMQDRILRVAELDVNWDTLPWNRSWLTRGVVSGADWVVKTYQWGHPDPEAEADFLRKLSRCKANSLRQFATGKFALAALAKEPIQINFKAIDGRTVTSEGLKGKVVLLQYWGTTCGPCVREIPALKELYKRYHADGFEIVGFPLDSSLPVLKAFVAKHEMPWPQRFDVAKTNEERTKYSFTDISNFILIGKDGKMLYYAAMGFDPSAVERLIKTDLGHTGAKK